MTKLLGRKKQHRVTEAFVCAEVSQWLTQVIAATEDAAVVLFPCQPTHAAAAGPSDIAVA